MSLAPENWLEYEYSTFNPDVSFASTYQNFDWRVWRIQLLKTAAGAQSFALKSLDGLVIWGSSPPVNQLVTLEPRGMIAANLEWTIGFAFIQIELIRRANRAGWGGP